MFMPPDRTMILRSLLNNDDDIDEEENVMEECFEKNGARDDEGDVRNLEDLNPLMTSCGGEQSSDGEMDWMDGKFIVYDMERPNWLPDSDGEEDDSDEDEEDVIEELWRDDGESDDGGERCKEEMSMVVVPSLSAKVSYGDVQHSVVGSDSDSCL